MPVQSAVLTHGFREVKQLKLDHQHFRYFSPVNLSTKKMNLMGFSFH